jgi:hypothetical protein
MPEAQSDIQKAKQFAFGGPVAKVTAATSALSVARLLFDAFTLPFSTLLANVFRVYRAVFHKPFDLIFGWLHWSIPPWLKDALLLYIIFGFIYQKVIWQKLSFDFRHPWVVQHNFKNSKFRYRVYAAWQLVKACLFWPAYFMDSMRRPYLAVFSGAHGPSSMQFTSERPKPEMRAHYCGDARLIMALRLASAIVGAAVIIALNYATS